MIPRARFATLLVCLSLFSSSPAIAQYMYLDSNGDGIHTAVDAVNPAGPTTVDIWLDTAMNRDGTRVICPQDPAQPLNLFSYVVNLSASGGTIAWGTFTNRQPSMTIHFGQLSNTTAFKDGYGGQTRLAPGRYLLGTLTLSVQSGSPAINIVPLVINNFDYTAFGSLCYGIDFDNTLKLGSDWFDADGLPFGTGGAANNAPALQQPISMTVVAGAFAFQTITATDADHQPLSFGKVSGPSFVTVSTTDVGTGTATGSIALAPLAADVGTSSATVSVTDGFASDSKTLSIEVVAGPNHVNTLSAPGEIRAVVGTTPRYALRATDPDGQALTFHKSEGPDYVEVATLVSGPGAAAGSLRLTPGLCDVGEAHAAVDVTDGITSTSRAISITVHAPRANPSQPPPTVGPAATVLALGDINGDGHLDVVSAYESFSSFLGQGDGTFVPSGSRSSGPEVTSLVLGDWNGDGHLDVALAVSPVLGHMTVMLGDGLGGFGPGTEYPLLGTTSVIRAGDLDNDGDLDLAVTHEGGVAVFIGHGDGTFESRTDYSMGNVPRGLVLADFNNDGRLDMATANLSSEDVLVRQGLGNGTFGDSRLVFNLNGAFELASGDWNFDGRADLAVISALDGVGRVLMGDGMGGFTPGASFATAGILPKVTTGDVNQDGVEDLIVSSLQDVPNEPTVDLIYGTSDGGFGPHRTINAASYGQGASGDLNEDGYPDIAMAVSSIAVWLNDAGGAGMPEARAFAESKGGGKPTTCVRLEPVAGSYRNADVDPTSLTLSPEDGGGSVHAITTKSAAIGDTDGNGIAEVPACFPRDGVAALFDTKNGRQTVTVHVQGALVDGRPFCASASIDIVGTGKKLAASLSPNPLNPGGILRLTTSRDGFVRVRMFDLQGRVVRVLEDRAMVPAGAHDVRIDGRNTSGQTLASGVYFYEVETVEGSLRGRITVLK